jgi:NAD(P)-dependent dehydrogenase (short-subunit alcohol dehydrogenase family)
MQIENTISVVTGGASGMGLETAKVLAQEGSKVVLLDKNFAAVTEAANAIGGVAIECEVTDAKSVEEAFANVQTLGAIRICVICAGIAPAKRIVGKHGPMLLDEFEQVIRINLTGTFNAMRCAAYWMMQSDPMNEDGERGVIVSTASAAAFEGQVGQAAYSASKGGVAAMTLPAAREFAPYGIRVVTIAPGIIETPMMRGMPESVQQSLLESVPFPHRMGKPAEYAALVEHIITNPMLNGTVIRLDGALRMSA